MVTKKPVKYNRYDKYQRQDYKNTFEFNNENKPAYYASGRKILVFTQRSIIAEPSFNSCSILFSEGRIDLSRLPMPLGIIDIRIDSIFASGTILINENIPTVIITKSAFASTSFNKGHVSSFGQDTYFTKAYRDGQPHYLIMVNSVFSNTEIREVYSENRE